MLSSVCNLYMNLSCGFCTIYTDLAHFGDLADKPIYTVSSLWIVNACVPQAGEHLSAFESACFLLRMYPSYQRLATKVIIYRTLRHLAE